MRLVDLFIPFNNIFPEIKPPQQVIQMNQKLVWTAITLFIYLVFCQIPLYGVSRQTGNDPFYWMRVILASNKGTLMELGISPIVTSGMIIQALQQFGFLGLRIKESQEDYLLYQTITKMLSIILTICEAVAYIYTGNYGPASELGFFNILLILIQLVISSFIVSLLDDMLQKGYGLGSGISLFIATNVCENIFWKCLSPMTINTQNGTEFEGSIVNFIQLMLTKPGYQSFYNAFYRSTAPNLNNLLATVLIFLLVIYIQGFQNEIKLVSLVYSGATENFPIKLFYTSNIPIILWSALISNLYFFSQLLWKRFPNNSIIGLFGVWQEVDFGGQSIPIGGLAYYISPPRDLSNILTDPFQFVIYVLFVLLACGFLAKSWILITNEGPDKVAYELIKERKLALPGHREHSLYKTLNRKIPVAAFLGGMCTGLLTIVADFMGAIGSGTGILLAVTIIYGYFEQFKEENAKSARFRSKQR